MSREYTLDEVKQSIPLETSQDKITYSEFYDALIRKLRGCEVYSSEGDLIEMDDFLELLWEKLPYKIKYEE